VSDQVIDWHWVSTHGDKFQTLLGNHVYLSVLPVVWGLMISLPLGLLCVRWPRIYGPVLAGTSILYALPSIALFVLLLDYTGLTRKTVIIPLTVYTLSVLVPNVVDGMRSVPDHVRQAAVAMGFTGLRRLLRVDLPIAVPIIMAGLRVATVANISLVSVGAFVGIGGLGELFTDGFQRDFLTEIITGIVLTVALAVVADTILVVIQRLLTPWARARRGAA
jgi:osmoprotectant transport system permease protein